MTFFVVNKLPLDSKGGGGGEESGFLVEHDDD